MESGSIDVVKYLLYVFNVILGITGVALIVIGIIVVADLGRFSNYLSGPIIGPPILFIILGVFVVATSVFGFYCIEKQNVNFLIVYALLLLFILAIEVFLAVVSSVSKENSNIDVRYSLKNSMGKYSFEETDRLSWTTIHRKLECCGVDAPRDWSIIFPENQVPVSCCKNVPVELGALCRNLFDDRIIYQRGCYGVLNYRVNTRLTIIMYISLAFALLQVIGVVLSCFYTFLLKKCQGSNDTHINKSRWQLINDIFYKNPFSKTYNPNTYSRDTFSRRNQLNNLLDTLKKQRGYVNRY